MALTASPSGSLPYPDKGGSPGSVSEQTQAPPTPCQSLSAETTSSLIQRAGDEIRRLNDSSSSSSCREGSPEPRSIRPPLQRSILTCIERRVRPSRMDCCDPESSISHSEFKGIINLCHTVGGVWLLANPLYVRYERGYWMDPELSSAMFKDFTILMTAWASCFVWSYTAFGLFCLRQRGLSRTTTRILMHSNQACMIFAMFALIRYKGWAIFPSTFVLVVTFLHYMKMHSFVDSILDYEDDPIAKARGFPSVCTLTNFTRYLLVPCLIYEPNYPRCTHGFRLGYFIRKSINLASTLMAIFLVASTAIIPVFEEAQNYSLVHTLARMVVPLLVMDFLFFYMMFEGVLNLLAEITDFGDREFYEDWWNCTTWEEFARKWNKPVHEFLLYHVYMRVFSMSKRSKVIASIATFMFSALLHETFLAVALGFVRFWMLGLMMIQIPLIMLSRYHKNTTFGNYYFWFGLCVGVPWLTVVYGREWAARLKEGNGH